jgi:DNA-binding transcriptional MerR regulator
MYRVKEFAAAAGVTIRALHHYDRLGLLKPLRRQRTGYRVYRDADFARLEQIVVLKFIGLPLRDIGPLLRKGANLKDVLRRQRKVLTARHRQIEAAINAIERAERSLDGAREPDWTLFTLVVKEIAMQDDTDWTKKYYSDDAHAKVEERKPRWSPELQEKVSRQWSELIADVETAVRLGENPSGAMAQSLAARWKELLAGFTGGDPGVQRGLNKMWADRDNWPDGAAKSFRMPAEVTEFIVKAMGADR